MDVLRFGVVGCGGRGLSVAHLIARSSSARLTAVCDVDGERARQASEQLKVPAFTRLEEMLEQAEIDALYVATPVEQHFAVARRAILDGKHVLMEKMMTTSAMEAWELVRLAEMKGVCGAISYQLRFYPSFQKWWELAQELQPLLIVSSRHPGIMPPNYLRPEPWAGIIDFLTHDLDLVLWVAGREPETVFATDVYNAITPTNAVDTLCVTLRFDSMMTGLVYGSMGGWGLPSTHVVIGRKGNVRVIGHQIEVNRITTTPSGNYERVGESVPVEAIQDDTTDRLLEHFCAWVQGLRDAFPLATLEDGFRVMLVHEAIWESCQTARPVALEAVRRRLGEETVPPPLT